MKGFPRLRSKIVSTVITTLALLSSSPFISSAETIQNSNTATYARDFIIVVGKQGEVESIRDVTSGVNFRSRGERAPECINVITEKQKGFIQVQNDCPFNARVKVILTFGPDSSCKLVVAGTRTNISPHLGRVDGVELC